MTPGERRIVLDALEVTVTTPVVSEWAAAALAHPEGSLFLDRSRIALRGAAGDRRLSAEGRQLVAAGLRIIAGEFAPDGSRERDRQVNIRVSGRELEQLQALADELGQTVSEYVRNAALRPLEGPPGS